MSWKLVGHGWAEALLKRHIAESTVRHAYLITGVPGLGKRTLALRFAQALNCTQAESPGGLCGRADCRACKLTPVQAYPDLHRITPDGSIKIDQIRDLQSSLALAPYEGRWRVALLTDFHLATESAANAMLRILEEPPPKVALVLTAPDAEMLPLTVVSRCELLQLRPVSRATIAGALERRGASPERAEFLAVLAAGRPGRAIAWAEAPELLEQRAQAMHELQALLGTGRIERFDRVLGLVGKGQLPVQRQRVSALLEHWISLWRDLVHAGYQSETEPVNPDLMGRLRIEAAKVPPERHGAALAALVRAQAAVDDYANLRMTLERLMLELPELDWEAEPAESS